MAVRLSPRLAPPSPVTAVIFDVDDTIWDTTRSYGTAILTTLDYLLGLVGRPELQGSADHSDLRLMRQAGSLNSDWDLTYVLFAALLSGYRDFEQAAAVSGGRGLKWALELRGAAARLEFDIMQAHFELVYWGHRDYRLHFGEKFPPMPPQAGTWQFEKPLVRDEDFAALADRGVSHFGIATGRSRLELDTVLRDGWLFKHIPEEAMCTADILRKPDPEVMDWCLERLGLDGNLTSAEPLSILYCGDTRDDLQLALNCTRRAKEKDDASLWVGCVSVVPESEFDFFIEEGAAACTDHVRQLPDLLKQLNERALHSQ